MDVLIDTDPGIDDALALMLALRSPELNVLGVSVVHGNVDVESGTRNALKILHMMRRSDIPVARGAARPLLREPRPAPFIHGTDGLGDLLPPPEGVAPIAEFGPTFIAQVVGQADRRVTLIGLGPLTNIAIAFLSAPHIVPKVERLFLMGGAVRAEGNTIPGAEFNMHCDPEAAAIVFRSGVPITMVGLDVTMKAIFPSSFSQRLRTSADSVERFVGEVTAFYSHYYRSYYHIEGCALHDPLTVGVAIEPHLVTGDELFVAIETQGQWTAGQTVPDFWGIPHSWGEPNAFVALHVDSRRFLELFCSRLFGRLP